MQLIYKNLKLNSTFLNNKLWDADSNCHNYNNHRITVTNIETKKRTSFEYWASVINPKIETETDMLFALYCFLTDAASGTESFKTFCSYYGYDEDSGKAYKIHQACKRALREANNIGLSEDDIYSMINDLLENHGI